MSAAAPKRQPPQRTTTTTAPSAPSCQVGSTSHAIHLYFNEKEDPVLLASDHEAEFCVVPAQRLNDAQRRMLASMAASGSAPPTPSMTRGKKYQLDDKGNCVVNFWPLIPRTQYEILINFKHVTTAPDGSEKILPPRKSFSFMAVTRPSPLSKAAFVIVNSKELTENPGITDLIQTCDEDYLIMLEQDVYKDLLFLEKLFWNALFILPHDDSPLSSLPNAKKRFCIDLEANGGNTPWLSSRKVKKYLKEFELVITNKLGDALLEAGELHDDIKGSTWITRGFCETLEKMALDAERNCPFSSSSSSSTETDQSLEQDAAAASSTKTKTKTRTQTIDHKIHNMAFILREKNTPDKDLVAATFGFACGQNYHDYTMATFSMDERSPGTLVTKLTGYILQKCGFKFWYWGMKGEGTSYMQEYEGKYGGVELERSEFYEKWNRFREEKLSSVKSFQQMVTDICREINLPLHYDFRTE